MNFSISRNNDNISFSTGRLSKIVGIKNVYTKNFLLEELKTNNNIKITPLLQALNMNLEERKPNTSYQCRTDFVIDKNDEYLPDSPDITDSVYRTWIPMLKKEYKLSSNTYPDWTRAKIDNTIRLNNQNLLYFGDLKGEWMPDTEYKKGDLVYVQSNYAESMAMPVGQKQTFVFICVKSHNSGSDVNYYQEFFRTDDDYTDLEGNHIFPVVDVPTDDFRWIILRVDNGSCRQWWFWSHFTNSVSATLYTTAMLNLRYPYQSEIPEDAPPIEPPFQDNNYLLFAEGGEGNSSSNNPAHTMKQNNGIIVQIDGILTLWASNWWKTETVTTSNNELEFPTADKVYVEDGNENNKFLWGRAESVLLNYQYNSDYLCNPIVLLPININIQPHASLYLSKHSDIGTTRLLATNLGSDITNTDRLTDGNESTTNLESLTYTFDHNQGCWYRENT